MVMDTCTFRPDSVECLRKKIVNFLDRALMKDSIAISDGVTIDKSKDAINFTEPMARHHTGSITDIVLEKIDRFFKSRVISINLYDEGNYIFKNWCLDITFLTIDAC